MDEYLANEFVNLATEVNGIRYETHEIIIELDKAWQGKDAEEFKNRLLMISDLEAALADQMKLIPQL